MGDSFSIKQNDTAPAIRYALEPASVDLTGAAVMFLMRRMHGDTVLEAAGTVVVATGAPTVGYAWQAGDTDAPGLYEGEFRVTYAGGVRETFPNADYIQISITEDIGPEAGGGGA